MIRFLFKQHWLCFDLFSTYGICLAEFVLRHNGAQELKKYDSGPENLRNAVYPSRCLYHVAFDCNSSNSIYNYTFDEKMLLKKSATEKCSREKKTLAANSKRFFE